MDSDVHISCLARTETCVPGSRGRPPGDGSLRLGWLGCDSGGPPAIDLREPGLFHRRPTRTRPASGSGQFGWRSGADAAEKRGVSWWMRALRVALGRDKIGEIVAEPADVSQSGSQDGGG